MGTGNCMVLLKVHAFEKEMSFSCPVVLFDMKSHRSRITKTLLCCHHDYEEYQEYY